MSNIKKELTSLLLAAWMCVLLSACGGSSGDSAIADGPPDPSAGTGLSGPTLPLNDVLQATAGLAATQLADMKTPQVLQRPALEPVPAAQCDSNSHPLQGTQGRVTATDINSAQADQGWNCNLQVVANYDGIPGGFRVWRYTDTQGQTCAYYDTSFAGGPTAIISLGGGPSLGVAVLDMDDPAHPRFIKTLTTLAMLAPHESLNLNKRRGLLAAEVGNAATLPGALAIYDVSQDCRHPQLKSQFPTITGHESGFSPDGKTFWVAGGFGYIQAIDVSSPSKPKELWRGAYYSHGLNFSADGNTMFHTDTVNGNLGVIDVSEIQDRQDNPKVHDISRVSWPTATIPQNSVPFTRDGHHYLLEFEEFAFRVNPATVADSPGAARILNIDDLRHPTIVSNIRLEVNMRAEHQAANLDPSALPPNQVLGYAFHYCAIPRQDNPQIAACTAINSGLRVFNISDPSNPREVAYYIAPPKANRIVNIIPELPDTLSSVSKGVADLINGLGDNAPLPDINSLLSTVSDLTTEVLDVLPGNLAFSQPAFDPARRQVWYTDAVSGFYVLQLSKNAWPQ